MNKNKILIILSVIAAVLFSCGGPGEILEVVRNSYDTPICFRVNLDGTGFMNVGTIEVEGYDRDDFTATAVGGVFTSQKGIKIYSTGGYIEGTYRIPWYNGIWDRYQGQGYVELNDKVGQFIAESEEWTIEIYFAMPSDWANDSVDQYLFIMGDAYPNNVANMGISYGNWFGLSLREMFIRYEDNTFVGLLNTAAKDGLAPDWGRATTDRDTPKGYWTQIAVTKTANSKISIYINGKLAGSNTASAWTSGTAAIPPVQVNRSFPDYANAPIPLGKGYLARTPYADGGPDEATVFGWTLAQAYYHHFAVDNRAWDAVEVEERFYKSIVGRGTLFFWE